MFACFVRKALVWLEILTSEVNVFRGDASDLADVNYQILSTQGVERHHHSRKRTFRFPERGLQRQQRVDDGAGHNGTCNGHP